MKSLVLSLRGSLRELRSKLGPRNIPPTGVPQSGQILEIFAVRPVPIRTNGGQNQGSPVVGARTR